MTAAQDAQQLALAMVRHGADPAWVAHAECIIEGLARTRDTFTSDDVWAGLTFAPDEPRALGAVLRDMGRRGFIAATDRTRPSRRVACHGRPVRVWRSRLR